jgi:hypothetical protein
MEMKIEATAETITVREPRGEWRFTIDGKNTAMAVPAGMIHSKSRWDHSALRQEFSSAQRRLVKTWSVDANDHLVLTERYESVTLNSESKAVFDRQVPRPQFERLFDRDGKRIHSGPSRLKRPDTVGSLSAVVYEVPNLLQRSVVQTRCLANSFRRRTEGLKSRREFGATLIK